MLKLLTVVALIVTLYVMEAQAGYKIEKNPKGYGSEYTFVASVKQLNFDAGITKLTTL